MRCGQPMGSCWGTSGWWYWCPATWNRLTTSGDRRQGRAIVRRTRRTTCRCSPSTSTCRVGIILCTRGDWGKCVPCISILLPSRSCPYPPAVLPQAVMEANKEQMACKGGFGRVTCGQYGPSWWLQIMQQSMQTEGGGATQNILTRTTCARSNNVVSHPNASKHIALAAQQSGFASSAMLRTLYQS